MTRGFYVNVFFQPLCIPKAHVFFNLGWPLGGGAHRWNGDTAAAIAALTEAIRREAYPFFDRIQSPRDAALAVKLKGPTDFISQKSIAYAFARGGDYRQATASSIDRCRLGIPNRSPNRIPKLRPFAGCS